MQTQNVQQFLKSFMLWVIKSWRCSSMTYGTPCFGVVHSIEELEKISKEDKKLYISGIGMFLSVIKHSQPDILNTVCKLSMV